MILGIYAIKDLKAAAFTPPFFQPRQEVAVRAFSDAIGDRDHPMSRHPEDYHLFYLGDFNDATGSVTATANGPQFLVSGLGETSEQPNG